MCTLCPLTKSLLTPGLMVDGSGGPSGDSSYKMSFKNKFIQSNCGSRTSRFSTKVFTGKNVPVVQQNVGSRLPA